MVMNGADCNPNHIAHILSFHFSNIFQLPQSDQPWATSHILILLQHKTVLQWMSMVVQWKAKPSYFRLAIKSGQSYDVVSKASLLLSIKVHIACCIPPLLSLSVHVSCKHRHMHAHTHTHKLRVRDGTIKAFQFNSISRRRRRGEGTQLRFRVRRGGKGKDRGHWRSSVYVLLPKNKNAFRCTIMM